MPWLGYRPRKNPNKSWSCWEQWIYAIRLHERIQNIGSRQRGLEWWYNLQGKGHRTYLHRQFEAERSCWQWIFLGIDWNSPVYKTARPLQCLSGGCGGNKDCGEHNWGRRIYKRNITILSESQAAIKTLSSNVMNSMPMYGCNRYLDDIAEQYDIHIICVSGHSR